MLTSNTSKTRTPILLLSAILLVAIVLPLNRAQAADNDTDNRGDTHRDKTDFD